ncbi:MAG: hypothetical protein HOV68_14755 [Streptomycetaceae bacterium]|nr:hypothetical protein [Streptomycetaceae bacterium]
MIKKTTGIADRHRRAAQVGVIDGGGYGEDPDPDLRAGRKGLDDHEFESLASLQNGDPAPPERGTREFRQWMVDALHHRDVMYSIYRGDQPPPPHRTPEGLTFRTERRRVHNAFDMAVEEKPIPDMWLSPGFAEQRAQRLNDLRAVQRIERAERSNHGTPEPPKGVVAVSAHGLAPVTTRSVAKASTKKPAVNRAPTGPDMSIRTQEARKEPRTKGTSLWLGAEA